MRFQDFLNHKLVTAAGMKLASLMPRKAGEGLAQLLASIVCRVQPALYHVVRNNLRQVLGPESDDETLEGTTRSLFVHAGRANLDFFQMLDCSAEEIAREISFPQATIAQIRQAAAEKRGALLLGTHMGNFNLAIPALLGHLGLPIQVLSVASPNEGFTLLNRQRIKWGLEVTPISPQTLRQAIERLKAGGVALTAFDFPIRENSTLIPFFGRPAYFPLGPARLARMTNAAVLMGNCHYDPQQGYIVRADTVEVERTQDRRQDVLVTAQRMAQVLERYVAENPDQWLMFYPFWPESGGEGATQIMEYQQAAPSQP
jgi:KDO2-lipid IV(A) lauroyltransferase